MRFDVLYLFALIMVYFLPARSATTDLRIIKIIRSTAGVGEYHNVLLSCMYYYVLTRAYLVWVWCGVGVVCLTGPVCVAIAGTFRTTV